MAYFRHQWGMLRRAVRGHQSVSGAWQVDQVILRMAKTGNGLYRDLDPVIEHIHDLHKQARPQGARS